LKWKGQKCHTENWSLSLQKNAETAGYMAAWLLLRALPVASATIAHKFAANGASVCLLDINRTHAETVAAEITETGGTASAYECDVSDRVSIGSTFQTILQQGRVHILVNNAGISHIGTVESTTEHDFDRVLLVNVKGYFNCIHAVIGKMKSAGGESF
jgi:NAD(P)-dependent dehydrogenase (short-subunit alcohol dehydrogenase family)